MLVFAVVWQQVTFFPVDFLGRTTTPALSVHSTLLQCTSALHVCSILAHFAVCQLYCCHIDILSILSLVLMDPSVNYGRATDYHFILHSRSLGVDLDIAFDLLSVP
jgi:hypothetical protein